MSDKTGTVIVSEWPDEWYQDVFVCSECDCWFMTYFNVDHTQPRKYCPNCGAKFIKELRDNG